MCKTVLCVDIGTTSLKSALISKTGEVVSFSIVKIKNYEAGFIANSWIPSLFESFKWICKDIQEKKQNISILGLCISGNGPTLVTEQGRTVLWNQKTFSLNINQLNTNSLFLPRLNLLRTLYPKEYLKSRYIFSGPEFFIYKLTNRPITILPEKRFKEAYWTKKECTKFSFDSTKLPCFVKIGKKCGYVTSSIIQKAKKIKNEYIHFTEKIPVFAGGPDFIVALIGTNSLQKGHLCDRCGSSEGLNFCIDKKIVDKKLRTLPSVIKGLWNVSYLIDNSGSMEQNQKLEELKAAFEYIKDIFNKNKIEFPKEMAITGGQINDTRFAIQKEKTLGIKIMIPQTKGFNHNELLGDACIAFTSLRMYKNLIQAAKVIVKEKPLI